MVVLEENTPVSMNMWGFTPDYFEYSEEFFKEFLKANMGNLKSEYFIPLMVNKLITEGTARVKVLDTTSKWFGVTYAADRQGVVDPSLGRRRRVSKQIILNIRFLWLIPQQEVTAVA